VSSFQAQASCLRSVVASERESISERLALLDEFEAVADRIDVRSDANLYVSTDKAKPGGRSFLGESDDGGVASALNHLHCELGSGANGGGDGHTRDREGKTNEKDQPDDDSDNDDDLLLSPEDIEERLEYFFRNDPLFDENHNNNSTKSSDDARKAREELEANVVTLCKIGEKKSSRFATRRSTICYAMNAKRSTHSEISSLSQFDGLCRVFASVLSGCSSSGLSSAVLLMGLSQHFYVLGGGDDDTQQSKKIYAKSRLVGHPLWDKDDFWDKALQQNITDTLNHSSVLSNFETTSERAASVSSEHKKRSEWTQTHKTRWHDLSETERYEAASQVNSVVFARVIEMSDSMLEFCGSLEKTSAFVRRVCVKNQLPVTQRTALLRHLIGDSSSSAGGR